jgi:predicted MFS family arabinose efflux permease
MTFATQLWMLYAASLLIGATSVIPQLFVPIAAELSSDNEKSANIGLVMSGLLLGILLSRFVGGIVGEVWGWRAMFGIAAGLMILVWLAVYKMLPELHPNFKGTYKELMRSVAHLARTADSSACFIQRGYGFRIYVCFVYNIGFSYGETTL